VNNHWKEPADPIGGDDVAVWLRLLKKWLKQFLIRSVTGARMIPDPNGGYHLVIDSPARGGAPTSSTTGFKGEYDPTKSYAAGDWFKISVALTVGVTTIAAGVWAVRPASSATDAQGFGPWAGTLPANPATAGIDLDKLFFNPENTAPTMGAAPNDKLYAELVNSYC
jgi:hypothetical protein